MFPFDIKLKKKIPISSLGSNHKSDILNFFANEFKERRADNLQIEGNVLRFRNKFFKLISNWNIMVPVDKGELFVNEENINTIIVHYQFSLRKTILQGVFAGIFFYLIFKVWPIGLFAFLWLGGMNWITAVIRHNSMFNDLIEKLTNANTDG